MLERNGELIHVDTPHPEVSLHDNKDDNNNNDTNTNYHKDVVTTSAAICMTPVSKRIATHIQKYMAIPVVEGKRLVETMYDTKDQYPYVVNQIVWYMARRALTLDFPISKIGGGGGGDVDDPFGCILLKYLENAKTPSSSSNLIGFSSRSAASLIQNIYFCIP